MHNELLYPNEYLHWFDLREKDVTLTISNLKKEDLIMVGGRKEEKWVVYFKEMEKRTGIDAKRLVLNKTNSKSIAVLHGHETDDWIGKKVTFYPTTTRGADGKTVECIRVRAPQHAQAKPIPGVKQ